MRIQHRSTNISFRKKVCYIATIMHYNYKASLILNYKVKLTCMLDTE
jgi:hypothetical protein